MGARFLCSVCPCNSFALLMVNIFTLFMVGILGVIPTYASVPVSDTANPVVAMVNGIPIHRDAVVREMEKLFKKHRISSTKFTSEEAEKRQYRNILDKLISIELFRQAVHSEPLPDAEKKLEERLRDHMADFPTEEAFRQDLEKTGKTLEGFRAELLEGILTEEYLKRNGLKDVAISEEEMERYYRQNSKLFTIPETVRVRHILVKPDAGSMTRNDEEALKKALEIRKQIMDGKSFSDMAREYSACSSASEGGDLGFVTRGYMPPQFDAVAFSLKTGEISEPVRTKFGYHIIEILEHRGETLKPFDDVKDFIRRSLAATIQQQRMVAHVDELRKKARIELFLDRMIDGKRQ